MVLKTPKNYYINSDKSKLQIEIIHNYLSKEAYWCKRDFSLSSGTKYRRLSVFWCLF